MAFKTRPRGIHATFVSECFKCHAEIAVTNGKPEPHDCRPWTQYIRAELADAEDGRALREEIFGRLEKAFDNQ